jgi:hypothetical protein
MWIHPPEGTLSACHGLWPNARWITQLLFDKTFIKKSEKKVLKKFQIKRFEKQIKNRILK